MNIFTYLHQDFNKPISTLLNDLTENKIIGNIVYVFADVPIFFLPAFLVWFWLYYTFKKTPEEKNKLLFILYSVWLAIFISLIIQNIIHIDRPEESLRAAGKLILKHIPDVSFPSDHASVSGAFLWWLLFFWYRKNFYIFLPLAILMLLSRIAWWVHWPLDIIVWLIIWFFSSFVIYKFQKINIFQSINKCILKFSSFFKL